VPLPWESDAPAYGFSPAGASWLPQPESWARYAVDAQDGVAGSTLEMYRTALRIRRDRSLGAGTLAWAEAGPEALDFTVAGVRVVANLSDEPLPLPSGEVLLSSGPVDGALPPDTTVWLTA